MPLENALGKCWENAGKMVETLENAGKMLGKWLKSNYHREISWFFFLFGKSVGIHSVLWKEIMAGVTNSCLFYTMS